MPPYLGAFGVHSAASHDHRLVVREEVEQVRGRVLGVVGPLADLREDTGLGNSLERRERQLLADADGGTRGTPRGPAVARGSAINFDAADRDLGFPAGPSSSAGEPPPGTARGCERPHLRSHSGHSTFGALRQNHRVANPSYPIDDATRAKVKDLARRYLEAELGRLEAEGLLPEPERDSPWIDPKHLWRRRGPARDAGDQLAKKLEELLRLAGLARRATRGRPKLSKGSSEDMSPRAQSRGFGSTGSASKRRNSVVQRRGSTSFST